MPHSLTGRATEEGTALRTLPALPMNFLDSTLRDWKVTLEPIAARKPGQLNVTCDQKRSAYGYLGDVVERHLTAGGFRGVE